MIEQTQLREWLGQALKFANAPSPSPARISETIDGVDLSFPSEKPLWTEWRRWLADLLSGADRERLRTWCLENCVDEGFSHTWNIGTSEYQQPFTFDERGRPQMLLEANSLRGKLAVVGAELLSPDSPFAVQKCLRRGCENLIANTLPGHRLREDGAPGKYCVIDGRSHALDSTERGQKARGKALQIIKRKRR
jgi:hypothetical protein